MEHPDEKRGLFYKKLKELEIKYKELLPPETDLKKHCFFFNSGLAIMFQVVEEEELPKLIVAKMRAIYSDVYSLK